jgi:hypothetical protein
MSKITREEVIAIWSNNSFIHYYEEDYYMKTIKKVCIKCRVEKTYKNFQRDSKEFKSCNECEYGAQIKIANLFKVANQLLDSEV